MMNHSPAGTRTLYRQWRSGHLCMLTLGQMGRNLGNPPLHVKHYRTLEKKN